MQTVVETPSYLTAAKAVRMRAETQAAVVSAVADRPDIGVLLKETGGFRKFRFAEAGQGKSGGYRIITFYSGPALPVFLITLFAKGERDNLSKSERNALAAMAKTLIATYAAKISKGTQR